MVDADAAVPAAGRRKRWLGAAAAAFVVGALGVYAVADRVAGQETGPGSDCPALQRLAGNWAFTTEVIGARSIDKIGMQGFYELVVELDGCAASARIEKLGFSGQEFSDARRQRAEASLTKGVGPFSFGYVAAFELRDQAGRGPDQEFVFATEGDELVGVWRQRGSRWTKSGLHGVLEGRPGTEISRAELRLADQSCDVRCVVACDAYRRERILPAAALDTCRSTCSITGSGLAVCGDRQPLPDDLRLALTGPESTLEAHCEDGACRLDPKLGRRRTPALTPKQLDAGRIEAHFLAMGDGADDAAGGLRLALRTQAGWFLSGVLVELGEADGSQQVTEARLYERSLGQAPDQRHVIGTFSTRSNGASLPNTFVCRLDETVPRCVYVPGHFEIGPDRRATTVTPLADDTLAIGSLGDDENEALRLYGW